MTYILLWFMLSFGGPMSGSAEFSDKAACDAAGETIGKAMGQARTVGQVFVMCLPKTSGKGT